MIERSTKTADDVIKRVFRTFGDESGVQITESDVMAWIDQAQRAVVSNNKEVLEVFAVFTVNAGQTEYDLSILPDVLRIHSLHWNGSFLTNRSFTDAQEWFINGNDSGKGTPEFWYLYGGVIHFYPTPSADTEVKLYYNKVPEPITASGSALSVPDNYFNAVVDFCLKQAYELDENAQFSQMKAEDFARGIQANALDNQAQNRSFQTVRDVYGEY